MNSFVREYSPALDQAWYFSLVGHAIIGRSSLVIQVDIYQAIPVSTFLLKFYCTHTGSPAAALEVFNSVVDYCKHQMANAEVSPGKKGPSLIDGNEVRIIENVPRHKLQEALSKAFPAAKFVWGKYIYHR